MAQGIGIIETEADKLVNLLKTVDEISVFDAAKRLNINPATIESLATLLQEEKILKIVYRLTTAFLIPIKQSKIGAQIEASLSKDEEVILDSESCETNESNFKTSRFETAPVSKSAKTAQLDPAQTFKTEELDLREFNSPEITIGELDADSKKSSINAFTSAEKKLNEIKIQKDFDSASVKIQPQDELLQAQNLLQKHDFSALKDIVQKKMDQRQRKFEEYHQNIEKAKIILPGLADSYDSFKKSAFLINQKLDEINSVIKGGVINSLEDLNMAEKHYRDIKQIYLDMPTGYDEERLALQERVLNIYKSIILSKKQLLSTQLDSKTEKINSLIKQTLDEINRGDKEAASRTYDSLRIEYSNLPEGFVLEKSDFQGKMLDLYQRLMQDHKNVLSKEFEKQRRKIIASIESAQDNAKKDNPETAQKQFHNICQDYVNLPSGFIEQKIELQQEILELYRYISLRIHDHIMTEIKQNHLKIRSLTGIIRKCISSDQVPLAQSAYKKLLSLYNQIPYAYLKDNKELAQEITQIHSELLSHTSGPTLTADKATRSDFEGLLQKLSEVSMYIKERKFDMLYRNYLEIYKIYQQLPKDSLKDKKKVYGQVYKIYEELLLYNEMSKLKQYVLLHDEMKAKEELSKIESMRKTLEEKYPEDSALFAYLKDIIRIHYNINSNEDSAQSLQKKLVAVSKQQSVDLIESTITLSDQKKADSHLKVAYG